MCDMMVYGIERRNVRKLWVFVRFVDVRIEKKERNYRKAKLQNSDF